MIFHPTIAFAGTALLIAVLTLYPFEPSFTRNRWAHVLEWHQYEKFRDFIANLLLFCPFGASGYFALRRVLSGTRASALVVVLGVGFSAVIEMLQAFDGRRDSSVNDVILNGISTGIGLLLARSLPKRFMPSLPGSNSPEGDCPARARSDRSREAATRR